jgi:hypothetical protein
LAEKTELKPLTGLGFLAAYLQIIDVVASVDGAAVLHHVCEISPQIEGCGGLFA